MLIETPIAPKAPRWITTEAGQWAWQMQDAWRNHAARAMSVQERLLLLAEAEKLRKAQERAE